MAVLPSLGLEFQNAAGIPVHSGVDFQQYFRVTFFLPAWGCSGCRTGQGRRQADFRLRRSQSLFCFFLRHAPLYRFF